MFCLRNCRAGMRERWAIGVSAAGSSQFPRESQFGQRDVADVPTGPLGSPAGSDTAESGVPSPGSQVPAPSVRRLHRTASKAVPLQSLPRGGWCSELSARAGWPVPPACPSVCRRGVIPPRPGRREISATNNPLGGCRSIRCSVIRHFADGTVRRPTSGNFSSREGATTRSASDMTSRPEKRWR